MNRDGVRPTTMTVALSEDEIDKTVVDSTGTRLGTVSDVNHGRAHVTADQHIVAEMDTKLPEGGIDEETYALDDDSIAEITDDEIILAEDV